MTNDFMATNAASTRVLTIGGVSAGATQVMATLLASAPMAMPHPALFGLTPIPIVGVQIKDYTPDAAQLVALVTLSGPRADRQVIGTPTSSSPAQTQIGKSKITPLDVTAAVPALMDISGLMIGIFSPGNAAGVLLPTGLTLWLIVGMIGRIRDSQSRR